MKQIRAMMIGAHPDDCDILAGGLALKYARAGHKVKFLSLANGSCGHHEMTPEQTVKRRRQESLAVAKFAGIEYDVWEDSNDCELMATLENRERLIRDIRNFNPDIIFTHRLNDYHADHRNAATLVQDASYLLIVPNYVKDAPAMKEMPAIMYLNDYFKEPPFKPVVAVDIGDVIDDKFKMLALHESQMFEWLPYTKGRLDEVPQNKEERLEWLHTPRVPRDMSKIDIDLINQNHNARQSEYREVKRAIVYRDTLIKCYGQEKGSKVIFAEAFGESEYGSPFRKELIPF